MGEDRTGEPQTDQRLTVAQAAVSMGISEGAVRSRIKRGTLHTTREGGAVFVLLGGGTSQADQAQGVGGPSARSELGSLAEELRARVAFLERELDRRSNEAERYQQIVAGLTQANAEQARTIRAIEAPASPEANERFAEAAETIEEEPETAQPRSDTAGPQSVPQRPQRLNLWDLGRRLFGR